MEVLWQNPIFFIKRPPMRGQSRIHSRFHPENILFWGISGKGAKDSRYFGPIERKEIKGKVLVVLRRKEI